MHDGETGDTILEVGTPAHKMGIYGLSFSRDGKRFVSVSADKSLKLWKVEDKGLTFLSQYNFSDELNNMLVSVYCFSVGWFIIMVVSVVRE